LSEEFYKRYQKVPPQIQRFTDPIVKVGIKVGVSNYISNTKKLGDRWIANKKSSFGKPKRKKR
jgi:hypothetical protein